MHSLGSLCRFLDELGSLEELVAPSGSKKNRRGEKIDLVLEYFCLSKPTTTV
jgi:hypothetical protein